MDIITERYNRCCEEFEKRLYGSERYEDYFLFNESMNSIRRDFVKHCSKGFHAARHTFVTKMVGEFQNEVLARTITGIRSDAFERYLHIYEEFNIKAKVKRRHEQRGARKKVA